MISLRVSESAALDMLAILQTKQENGLNVSTELDMLRADLATLDLSTILASPEYAKLLSANRLTFRLVELAKRDLVPASAVDSANYQRFLTKKALQNRFWPTEPLLECKTTRSN